MRFLLIITTFLVTVVLSNGNCNTRSKREVQYYNSHSYHNNVHDYSAGNDHSNYYNPLNYPPKCKSVPHCVDPSTLSIVDISWMIAPRLYYATAGGCHGYVDTAKTFLGRDVRSVNELNEMCNTIFLYGSHLVYFQGYNTQFVYYCDNYPTGGRNCTVDPQLSNIVIDESILKPKQVYPVLTDNVSFTVYIRCYNGNLDIITLSTEPFLEEDVVTQIMNVADIVGFPQSELLLLPCNYPLYPFPLQTYLQQSGPYKPNICLAAL